MIAFACLTIGLTAGYILKGQMDKAVGTLGCGPEDCHDRCPGWNQCDQKWAD